MKRIILFFVTINITLIFLNAQVTSLRAIDGNFWLNSNEYTKAGMICGFYLGLSMVQELGMIPNVVLNNLKKMIYSSKENVIKKESTEYIRLTSETFSLLQIFEIQEKLLKESDFANITIKQLVDGIDNFYKNFANRKIKLIDAIYITKMEIRGEDPDLIMAQVRYLRMMPDVLINRDKYTEKIGNIPLGPKEIKEALLSGKITKDDFLKAGIFADDNGNIKFLFYYGVYE